jgi:hypothetical protein
MTEWNVPLDVTHQIARRIMAKVREDLVAVRQPDWEPSPMPEDYHPSYRDRLHPRPYSTGYLAIDEAVFPPHHHGDEVFFYDYSLPVGGQRSTTSLYPDTGSITGVST